MNTKDSIVVDDFEVEYESYCPCSKEILDWYWEESDMCFFAECGCMKRFSLKPTHAIRVHQEEDFEEDEEEEEYDD